MPRHTPSTGRSPARSTSRPTAKSAGSSGCPGPGDSTTWLNRGEVGRLHPVVLDDPGSTPVTAATRCTRFQV